MEGAHIIDESDGGSDDAENGIPVCFDCHQKIAAYNDAHPRGNKFRPHKLKARRNRIYLLVETGTIYAQVVAERARSYGRNNDIPDFPEEPKPPALSAEAKRFLKVLLTPEDTISGVGRKLALLNEHDRAYILVLLCHKMSTRLNL